MPWVLGALSGLGFGVGLGLRMRVETSLLTLVTSSQNVLAQTERERDQLAQENEELRHALDVANHRK